MTLEPRSSTQSSVELESYDLEERRGNSPVYARELSPADRGKTAYLFLLAAFITQAVTWALPVSFGVLLDWYLDSPLGTKPYASTILPVIGTVSQCIIYCAGPPCMLLSNTYPQYRRKIMMFGSVLSVSSLGASSFASQPWQFLLTQSIFYSIGAALQWHLTVAFLMEHFVARRGLANGVCFSGTAVSGVIMPYIYPALLSNYSLATTLRAIAVAQAVLLLSVQPFVKGRLPNPKQATRPPLGYNKALFQNKLVWLFLTINTLQAAGMFTPIQWLPTYVSQISNDSSSFSPATIVAYNGAALFSRVGLGHLSDRMGPHYLGSGSSLVSALAVFLLWGYAGHYIPATITCSAIVGLAAGGYTSLWAGAMRQTVGLEQSTSAAFFGLCALTRGLGGLIGGTISPLMRNTSKGTSGFWPIIIYTGVALSLSSTIQLFNGCIVRKRVSSESSET